MSLLDSNIKYLYFGSSKDDIKEITSGKFLTTFKSIACCFAIDLNECYGELNKKYTLINWGYDQWEKSENYLNKQEIPKLIKITNNAKEWIKTEGTSQGYLYSIKVDDYLLNHLERFNASDPKWEVIYNGNKKIPVKLIKKLDLNWKCEYSPIKSKKYVREIKRIDFPNNEIQKLKEQNIIITTRVSKDYNEFFENDIVYTPWQKNYIVSNRVEIKDLNKHPYYSELTKEQIQYLKKFNKIAILTLEKIYNELLPGKIEMGGFARIGAEKYEPPYDIEILKEKYPKLLEDPVHKWRAKTGIELIHKQPDFQEQKRIFYNWLVMSKTLQEKSDNKSKQLFDGMTNLEHHNAIMEYEWHDENYFELADIRQRYDKKDMEENGLKYIHISLSNKPITFVPRIPENVFDLKGNFKQYSENKTIPRICCSDSIFGAISAIKINENKTYYVHLLEPKKVLTNKEVCQYVPDAIATGECWILDDNIKSSVVGKLEICSSLPYVYTFLKNQDNFFRCVRYHDYNFIPYESKFNRTYRNILNKNYIQNV